MLLAALDAADVAYLALSVFLLSVGLGLAYMFVRLGGTFGRLSALIRGAEEELLPVINKVGGSVDRVNGQLDKLDQVTDSAVDAADGLDTAVRAVSIAVARPVQKVAGFAEGVRHGAAVLFARRDWRAAIETGRSAAARRESEIAEELQRDDGTVGATWTR